MADRKGMGVEASMVADTLDEHWPHAATLMRKLIQDTERQAARIKELEEIREREAGASL